MGHRVGDRVEKDEGNLVWLQETRMATGKPRMGK